MNNIHKHDLGNRFDSHSFNITERGSLFDIEVLDENRVFVGKTTVGSESCCYRFARRLLGVNDHVLPMLTWLQRDRLVDKPDALEVVVVSKDEHDENERASLIYTKYRLEENDWV